MTRAILSTRDSATLLTGMGVIAGILLIARVAPAIRRFDAEHFESASAEVTALKRARSDLKNAPSSRRLLDAARKASASTDSLTLLAPSPAEAGAQLAEIVASAADSADLNLGTVQLKSDLPPVFGLWPVVIRANLTGDLESLATFLSIIEEGRPLVAVRELSVVQPDPALPNDKTEALQVEIAIEALARQSNGDVR